MNLLKLSGELKRLEALVALALGRSGSSGNTSESLVRVAIGIAAAKASVTVIPAGAIVTLTSVDVQTPYSVGTTITVGSAGFPSLLMGAGQSAPTIAGLYQTPQDTVWPGGTVRIAVAGGPVAGAGFVLVEYTATPKP